MSRGVVGVVVATLTGLLLPALAAGDECRYQEPRSASIAIAPGAVVEVRQDGSGDIEVTDVGGDFEVGSAGSGNVSYERVNGHIGLD